MGVNPAVDVTQDGAKKRYSANGWEGIQRDHFFDHQPLKLGKCAAIEDPPRMVP
jgi:hypothetical protein